MERALACSRGRRALNESQFQFQRRASHQPYGWPLYVRGLPELAWEQPAARPEAIAGHTRGSHSEVASSLFYFGWRAYKYKSALTLE